MTKTGATPIVIDTFDTEGRAVKAMHRYATNLRRLKKTGRYGVFIEKHRVWDAEARHWKTTWWLCLADRGANK